MQFSTKMCWISGMFKEKWQERSKNVKMYVVGFSNPIYAMAEAKCYKRWKMWRHHISTINAHEWKVQLRDHFRRSKCLMCSKPRKPKMAPYACDAHAQNRPLHLNQLRCCRCRRHHQRPTLPVFCSSIKPLHIYFHSFIQFQLDIIVIT